MSDYHENASRFLDRYLNGELLAGDIDDFIDAWHDNPQGEELHDSLGMTVEEYSLWLRDPETLPHIARARRTGIPLADVLRSALEDLPVAARSADAARVQRLTRWLERAGKIY